MNDYKDTWKLLFEHSGEFSTLQIYVDERSGEMELVQMNDEGEAIRTCLSSLDSSDLIHSLCQRQKTAG